MIEDRNSMIQKLEDVRKNLTRRHQDIEQIGMQTAEVKAEIKNQNQLIEEQKTRLVAAARQNKELELRVEFGKNEVAQKKNDNKKMEFETNSNLQA